MAVADIMTCASCHWSISDGAKLICRLGYALIKCREFVYEPGTDEGNIKLTSAAPADAKPE